MAYSILDEEERALMLTDKPSADILGLGYRTMSGPELDRIQMLKEMGAEMLDVIRSSGSSRELELAQTRLEEAIFWAVKHVALNGAQSG